MITNVYWLVPNLEANWGCSTSLLNLTIAWISHLGVICYHLQSLPQRNTSALKDSRSIFSHIIMKDICFLGNTLPFLSG